MSTLKIEYVDLILAPTCLTFGFEGGTSVAEPNLFPQGCLDFNLTLLNFGHVGIVSICGFELRL
jgi:hypothetical protein